MITPSDIVNHLAEYLPRISDKFSDSIAVDSATISGGRTVTVNTTSAHGLSVSDPLMFVGGQTSIPISTVTEETEDETALIEFSTVHDFTTPNATIETESLPCVGFNESEWNTTLEIIEAPTDQSVVVNFPTGATGIPTFTTAKGYEERPLSIFGTQSVATTPTPTQFTVELSTDIPVLPTGDIINLSVTIGARIAAADTIERAEEIYSEVATNDDLWAFVIMMDADVSKDRHTLNDSIACFAHQNEMRLRILNNFAVVVFFRTSDSLSGVTAQELAYGEVYTDLLQVLYGFGGFAVDEDNSFLVTVTAGHNRGIANTSYYTQVYEWQVPIDITVDNGFNFYDDVALRQIDGNFPMFDVDETEKLTIAFQFPDQVKTNLLTGTATATHDNWTENIDGTWTCDGTQTGLTYVEWDTTTILDGITLEISGRIVQVLSGQAFYYLSAVDQPRYRDSQGAFTEIQSGPYPPGQNTLVIGVTSDFIGTIALDTAYDIDE